jgi:prepilin-type N-terminal cleavage/methylation domain-containing protein
MMRMDALRRQTGYSLLELIFVLGIMGVLTGIAVVQIENSRSAARGDAAMRVVLSQMNRARELAITQRHFMRVVFDTTANEVLVIREDTTATVTVLSTLPFEGGAGFSLVAGLPDTPDAFGDTAATWFTSSAGTFSSTAGNTNVAKFTPDGTLVDWNGHTANGSVFVAVPGQAETARAVTILGSTGRVRGFRWDGHTWKVV